VRALDHRCHVVEEQFLRQAETLSVAEREGAVALGDADDLDVLAALVLQDAVDVAVGEAGNAEAQRPRGSRRLLGGARHGLQQGGEK
jgi:hypothetical protein